MPVLIRRATDTLEWSLFDPSLRGATSIERGYIATTDEAVARGWARTYGNGFGNEKAEPRDVYVEMQAAARVAHAAYVRTLPVPPTAAAISAAVVAAVGSTGAAVDAAAVAAAVKASLAADFAAVNANIDDQPVEFQITPKE